MGTAQEPRTGAEVAGGAQGLGRGLTEYGDPGLARFLRRSFARSLGLSDEALSRPVVGILSTASDLNSCHRGMPALAAAVERGVWQAGGLPLVFPTISLGEVYLHPSSLMMRNLMAMDVEVMLRAQPLDAAVLLGGCDKTVPALVMGAASASVPVVVEVTGPMLTGSFRGQRVSACTDCRRFWAAYRRGELGEADLDLVSCELAPTAGTCGVMGTASTMACLVEAMGLMLPGGAAIPAVHAERLRHAEASGKTAVALAASRLTPASILDASAFRNALRVLQAIGGSTNAIIHLTAIAGRVGVRLALEDLDAVADTSPLLVDLKPSGDGYMEDFYRAGGVPVVLRELSRLLDLDARTISGATLRQLFDGPYDHPAWQSVIRPVDRPLAPCGSLVVLRGNLAPQGALLKRSAASPQLLESTGRAVVFDSVADLAARIDDPELPVSPGDVLVLRNAGLKGGPGMPEAGCLPLPRRLAERGVKDMVRISDARMSGTAFGTVLLHVSPEAADGGPIALVNDGDRIRVSASRREVSLLVDDAELAARRVQLRPWTPTALRGYERLFLEHVQPVELGADFDFLRHESLVRGEPRRS